MFSSSDRYTLGILENMKYVLQIQNLWRKKNAKVILDVCLKV